MHPSKSTIFFTVFSWFIFGINLTNDEVTFGGGENDSGLISNMIGFSYIIGFPY